MNMMKKYILGILISFFLFPMFCNAESELLNAFKFTFLSWITGSTKISYERAIPEYKQTSEICAGLICAGYDKYQNNPRGFTLRYGHKFFVGNYNPKKPFDGFFVRPEIIYTRYEYDSKVKGKRTLSQMESLLGTIGYQKTFGRFIVDGWGGAGFALGTPAETGYEHGFQIWNWFDSYNKNVALSFSIRLGWIF